MSSEYFNELMSLVMGPYLCRIDAVKKLLDDLDLRDEGEKRIAYLYLKLSADENEKSTVNQVVNAVYGAKSKPISPEGNEKLVQVAEEVGEIIVSDVHRNEQVNIVALIEGLQTILCCNLARGTYYALWPMVGDSDRFELSPEGKKYQWQIRRALGDRLDRFPKTFVAGVYASSRSFHNTIEFWEDMRSAGLFKYWDPEKGPHEFSKEAATPEIQLLRVYKVDRDLKQFIVPNAGFRHAPLWKGGPVHCKGVPVLTDQEMEKQLTKFNEILRKHGNPPANGPY